MLNKKMMSKLKRLVFASETGGRLGCLFVSPGPFSHAMHSALCEAVAKLILAGSNRFGDDLP